MTRNDCIRVVGFEQWRYIRGEVETDFRWADMLRPQNIWSPRRGSRVWKGA